MNGKIILLLCGVQAACWGQTTNVALMVARHRMEAGGPAHYLFHLRRAVGNAAVDLKPLAAWWTNTMLMQEVASITNRSARRPALAPVRPLAAWDHVTGSSIEVRALGWIVSGKMENTPGHWTQVKFFLRHPPQQEKARFEALTDTAAKAGQYGENMSQAARVHERESETAAEQHRQIQWQRYVVNDSPYQYGQLNNDARTTAERADRAQRDANNARQEATASYRRREDAEKELAHFCGASVYTVDTFALRTGELVDGLPVYDIGLCVDY